MKPLYVPNGGEPGQRMGGCIHHLRLLLLDAGYSVTDQEAFDVHVWLGGRRGVEGQTHLLTPPITEDEIDAMIAEGVVVLERADAGAGGNGDTDADTHAWDGK